MPRTVPIQLPSNALQDYPIVGKVLLSIQNTDYKSFK